MLQKEKNGSLSLLISQKNILHDRDDFQNCIGDCVIFNTESVLHYLYDARYREYCDSVPNLALDGSFLKLALFLRGIKLNRYHGPDLMSDVMHDGVSSCYLIGGNTNNIELVNSGLIKKFISLSFSQDISELLDDFRTEFIVDETKGLVFFVSLGLPKQEIFARQLRLLLTQEFELAPDSFKILPIGAAADFFNGSKVRSGLFWRKFGLEWLPRLFREPRMFIRNVRSFFAFFLVLFRR